MDIQAHFSANFKSFSAAVAEAEKQIKGLETVSANAGERLNAMTDKFSGRKLVDEMLLVEAAVKAIGGTSALTAKELQAVGAKAEQASEKLRAMGQKVPEGFTAIADAAKAAQKDTTGLGNAFTTMFSAFTAANLATKAVSTLVSFGQAAIESAGHLVDLSNKTGLSIDSLQEMEYVAGQTGVTVDAFTDAAFNLGVAMAGDKDSAKAAAKALGLEFTALKAMSIDDQFTAIADALMKIEDPQERNRIAMELFGKSAKAILPAIAEGYIEIASQATKASEAQVRAVDRAADALDRLTGKIGKATLGFLGQLALDIENTYLAMVPPRELTREQEKQLIAWLKAGKSVREFYTELDAASKRSADAWKTASTNAAAATTQIRATDVAVDKLTVSMGENAKATTKAKPPLKAITDEAAKLAAALAKVEDVQPGLVEAKFGITDDTLKNVLAFVKAMEKLREEVAKIEQQGIPAIFTQGGLGDVGEKVPVVTQQVRTLNDEFLALADAVAFLGAVSGGAFGQMAMDLANVMAAGQAGDQARASWDAASGATGKTAAGIGIIAGGYAAIDNATSTRGKGTNALKGAAAGAMYGSAIMPGWGTAIGAGVGAVYGWWKGGKDERKTNDMRDELMAASGGFDELNKKAFLAGTTIKDVLDAKYPEQFEAAVSNLNAAFDFQAIALAAVDETAKKYGFTLEELGPALQRQELDQQAQELFKDWEVLNAAGIDTIAIQTRMSESVSEYLQTAIRMGAEIPAAMQPMLEDMAKAGQLTDANGDKIEDLEGAGVKWSLTMSEGFTKLIDAVTKLSEVISKNLGTSLDNTHAKINAIPKYVDVNVAYHEQNRPAPVATEALEGYQHGTDGFRNFGAGTPVMLHGWEAVVPREGASTAGAALGGAEGGATIVVNAQGAFFDTPGSLQQLADRVEAALSARHGLKNKRRAA